jgi:hypothetical protein
MKQVILVPGTHAWDGVKKDWYSPGQPFHEFMVTMPGHALVCPSNPFVWSTRLGGVGFGDGDLVVYRAAGMNLFQYCVPPRFPDLQIPPCDLVVISHSHGLQPVLFAAMYGLKIDLLIDVSGPVRQDLMPIAQAAKPNIRRWVHTYGGRRDRWQWLGGLFDGHVGVERKHPLAENLQVPGADHGEVLREPRHQLMIKGILEGTIHGE